MLHQWEKAGELPDNVPEREGSRIIRTTLLGEGTRMR